MEKIQVLLVDDHPLMREALQDAIRADGRFEIIGEAVNGKHAIELASRLRPQVILMDISMPVMDGIDATRQILRENPATRILTLTSSNEDEKIVAAIRAGARGYILKDSPRQTILLGLCEVAAGRRFLLPEIADRLSQALQDEQETLELTVRENEILGLLGEGKTNPEIANLLVLSEATVRVHLSNIRRKLNLNSRSQLMLYINKGGSAQKKM